MTSIPFGIDDADVMLDDFGADAQVGVQTLRVLLDMPGDVVQGGEVMSTEYRITCLAASANAAGLRRGVELVIARRRYALRADPAPIDDGLLVVAPLTFEGLA